MTDALTHRPLHSLVRLLVATLAVAAAASTATAQDAEPFDHLQLELVADGFTAPVALTSPPGDARRFVADQVGLVHILAEDGTVHEQPFLDIRDRRVTFRPQGFDERGLLGMAFHPNYADNGRFFVYTARHYAPAATPRSTTPDASPSSTSHPTTPTSSTTTPNA